MLLALEIGNTTVAAALWADGAIAATWRGATQDPDAPVALAAWVAAHEPPVALVAASVVPAAAARWRGALGLREHWVGNDLDPPIERVYQPREALGSDRLLAALAARERWGAPVLVADCGTASTLDAVDARGVFVGGAILCGLETMRDALAARAAQLPPVPLAAPARALGTSTVECLQVGLVRGHAGSLAALADALRAELDAPTAPLIGTGGLSLLLAEAAPGLFAALAPHLVLEGLALTYERCVGEL